MSTLAHELADWVKNGRRQFAFGSTRDGKGKKTLDVIGGRRFVVTIKGRVLYDGPSSAFAARVYELETDK